MLLKSINYKLWKHCDHLQKSWIIWGHGTLRRTFVRPWTAYNILFSIRGSTKQGILEWNHTQKTGQTLAKWNSSISDEICELIIKEIIREHLKEDTHTNQLRYGFTQTKSWQTNSISSFNRVSSLIGQGIVEILQIESKFQPGIWQVFWGFPCWWDN